MIYKINVNPCKSAQSALSVFRHSCQLPEASRQPRSTTPAASGIFLFLSIWNKRPTLFSSNGQ